MRKKVLALTGVIAVLAVVLSVTAFAKDGVTLPEYNLITVIQKSLEMTLNSVFKIADVIYIFFRDLFA